MKNRFALFCLTLVLGLAFCSPAFGFGSKWVENEDLAVNFHREVMSGGYKVVKTDELKAWMDKGKKMLIIDTMPLEASYVKEHIPGAVPFVFPIEPMPSIDDAVKADFEKLLGPDKGRLLVFYCGFTKCTRSHNGALWAVKLGYTNVYRCPGGIKAWDERDFDVEKGK